ncbi:MAG: hypothetical protein HY966_03480 [Ignavibacteriales bacterium]|nr:hypothetical protein [Ignavibacteriales bacterium]
MKKSIGLMVVGAAFVAMSATGCKSAPSAEELKQLDDLKAEVSSIEKEINARQTEKAALQRAIAEKDSRLQQCLKDKEAVQQHIKGMM